jgi:hypothetical protein
MRYLQRLRERGREIAKSVDILPDDLAEFFSNVNAPKTPETFPCGGLEPVTIGQALGT